MVTRIGIDLDALTNISAPDYNLTNKTALQLLDNVPVVANNTTEGYLGLIVLSVFFIFIVWKLSDRSNYSTFYYGYLRAVGIAGGICSIFGIINLSIGYYVNFIHIAYFYGIFVICIVWIWFLNN